MTHILYETRIIDSERKRIEFKTYSYDKSTGLFDGKKISELNLGFEEADMQVKAPAALETEQGEH